MKLITIKRSVDRGDLEEHPKLCISHLGKLHKNADPWAPNTDTTESDSEDTGPGK